MRDINNFRSMSLCFSVFKPKIGSVNQKKKTHHHPLNIYYGFNCYYCYTVLHNFPNRYDSDEQTYIHIIFAYIIWIYGIIYGNSIIGIGQQI